MIRCRILGPINLSGPDGQSLDDVVTQPRRLALLAYLAMHAPRGFIRRDALFPVFWPDMDQDRARGALRQALYVLRGAVGDGVVVSRGAEEVAVAADQLWCDAIEFERACDDKRWADALDLYRGDFLQAFFIADAPQFEQWMQEQQGRLRLRGASAARSLAAEQEKKGALKDATVTLRRALAVNGSDEESLRHLIILLDAQGDRAGAVKEYEAFVARLSEEFGVPPSAETIAVFERVRDRDEARPGALRRPTPGAPAQPTLPGVSSSVRGYKNWIVAAGVVIALALAVRGAWSRFAPNDAPERVAVLPFEISANPEHGYLREALVDLLSTDLDGAGGMQTIDPNAVRASDTAVVKLPSEGRAAAKRLGARFYILGRAVVAGSKLRVFAALYDQGDKPLVEATREGASEELFAIVDGLAADLLTSSQRAPDVRMSQSAAMTTQSLPALKAYLEGEQTFQRGDDRGARDALRRAVAIDSTFALANYRLSVVVMTSSTGAWTEISESGERALRHGSRLSERDRLLLSAHMSSVKEDFGLAEQQYRAIVARYPDELEGWFRLAEVIFHETPLTGRSLVDAREPFERLLALDPSNRHALQHLMWIAAVQKRLAAVDSLYQRILSSGLTPTAKMEARALWTFTCGSAADREEFFAAYAAADAGVGMWVIHNFARDMDAAMRLTDLRARVHQSEAERRSDLVTRARLFAVRGQMDRANAELKTLERLDHGRALQEGAFFAIMPFRSVSESELRSWRTQIAAWEVERSNVTTSINNDVDGPFRQHVRFFMLGYVDGLLRDAAAVRADVDSLEGLALPQMPDAAQFVAELSASVRAHALWRQGNAKAALNVIDHAPVARQYHYRNSFMRRQDRYFRAELLFAAGRYAEAFKWYSAFDYITLAQTIFAMPAHLRRGEILEKLGNPRDAAANYREFANMWRNADTVFRPMTELADARLKALGAK